jgi:hypothetical protein
MENQTQKIAQFWSSGERKMILEEENQQIARFSFASSWPKKERKIAQKYKENSSLMSVLQDYSENWNFDYLIISPLGKEKHKNATILFHGFNERNWNKYYPWAIKLVKETAKAVVLFPFAYHINRSPAHWTDLREMSSLSQERKIAKKPEDADYSSFINVALSSRMEYYPQQFYFSGMQSYLDYLDLFSLIRSGEHPLFEKNTEISFFAYSIGCLLAQIILLANPEEAFARTKSFLFCGGSSFDRMNGVSKYIIDSFAAEKLSKFNKRLHEKHLFRQENNRLNTVINAASKSFISLLQEEMYVDFREERWKAKAADILVYAFNKDKVVPIESIKENLLGKDRSIPIKLVEKAVSYDFVHEQPFKGKQNQDEAEDCFEEVFNLAAEFLK